MAPSTACRTVLSIPELLEHIVATAAVSLLEPQGAIAFHYGRDATRLLLRLKAVSRAWNAMILTSPRCRRLLFVDAEFPCRQRRSSPGTRRPFNPFIHTTFQVYGQHSVRATTRSLQPLPFLGVHWAPHPKTADVLFLFVNKKVFRKWPLAGSWRNMMLTATPLCQAFVSRLDNLRPKGHMWCAEDILDRHHYALDPSGLSCGRLFDLVASSIVKRADDGQLAVVCSNSMPFGIGRPIRLDEMQDWLNRQLDSLHS